VETMCDGLMTGYDDDNCYDRIWSYDWTMTLRIFFLSLLWIYERAAAAIFYFVWR